MNVKEIENKLRALCMPIPTLIFSEIVRVKWLSYLPLCFVFPGQVCDYDFIGGGDPIGKIWLGMNQSKKYKPGYKHWKECLENPRRPVIKWHVLQVNQICKERETRSLREFSKAAHG